MMRSCEVTLISSSAEMPWTQAAATVTVDVCRIKGYIEMTESKALPASNILFLFSESSEALLWNNANPASCLYTHTPIYVCVCVCHNI